MSSGQRFDTAEIDVTKPAAEKRRRRKNRHKKPEGRVPRWVYRIILILILCVVSMLLWLNRSNLAPANVMEWVQTQVVGMGIGDGYPYPIVGSTVSPGNFKSVNRQLVMLRDTELTELNSTAKEILRRQHSYSKPVLKINGLRSLIYNLGGKGYQIESQSGTLVKANAQQNIFAGGLASNGRFALLTEADGYFGCLTAYSADNQVLFHYWFSDCYPTAVALNPEGTQAVVTGVSAKDGGLTSSVYLLDFGSSKTVAPVAAYKENMLMDASWAENGMAIAIGDKMASVIDTVTRKKQIMIIRDFFLPHILWIRAEPFSAYPRTKMPRKASWFCLIRQARPPFLRNSSSPSARYPCLVPLWPRWAGRRFPFTLRKRAPCSEPVLPAATRRQLRFAMKIPPTFWDFQKYVFLAKNRRLVRIGILCYITYK